MLARVRTICTLDGKVPAWKKLEELCTGLGFDKALFCQDEALRTGQFRSNTSDDDEPHGSDLRRSMSASATVDPVFWREYMDIEYAYGITQSVSLTDEHPLRDQVDSDDSK